jgi:hypothetical protein
VKRLVLSRTLPSLKLPSLKSSIALLAALVLVVVISAAFLAAPAFASGPSTGVDFAWHGTLDPQTFKDAGADFVVRYLAGGKGSSKEITHYEADMWSKAGVGLVLVWETTATRATQGYNAGYHDASLAYPQAASMGMPDGKPVYFAVDTDATGSQVDPYFHGIYDWARTHFADGRATSRIGVYGGHDVVEYVRDAGYAKYGWQALAWMHGKGWLPDAMQQYGVEKTIGGVDSDLDRVYVEDYGVWFSTCVVKPSKPVTKPVPKIDSGRDAQQPASVAGATTTQAALPQPAQQPLQPQTAQQSHQTQPSQQTPQPQPAATRTGNVATSDAAMQAQPASKAGQHKGLLEQAQVYGMPLQLNILGLGTSSK